MSSISADWTSYAYWLWNLAAFGVAIPLNSFIEWATHRFVMHRPCKLIPYGYLHTTSHHARFGADASYYAYTTEDRDHILFTWKEYTLLPIFCLLAYAPVEWMVGKPILIGVLAATLFGLQMFNSLHWRFHVPCDTWFQRTRFFRFLKEHHRLHHKDMSKNFNVYFLPLADLTFGTLITTSSEKK